MDLLEKYQKEDTWYGKVIVMEIYHLAQSQAHTDWTVTKTAGYFHVSISLASENLSLAKAMHEDKNLINCKSRVKALERINK